MFLVGNQGEYLILNVSHYTMLSYITLLIFNGNKIW